MSTLAEPEIILPPAAVPVPAAAPARPPQPQMALPKCMVVFLFTTPDDKEVHKGRLFLQGVANLRTQLAVEQTEKAIIEHQQGRMTAVTIIDWKGLDG